MKNLEPVPKSQCTVAAASTASIIYRLEIKQFRGIKDFSWYPAKGVNVILGGGDVGKTTILDAIALLLSPTNAVNLSDTDYHRRDIEAEFVIEAILSLPRDGGINEQFKSSWPWEWNGNDAVVPSTGADGATTSEPVYRLRVRGTADLELAFEIVQPDGTADSLSVSLRRSIGLVRLSGDDRSDRELRLVQGSALDRLLSDKALRSRIASELAKTNVRAQLTQVSQTALENLDGAFTSKRLPAGLDLSITGGPGASIASLIGLTANCDGVPLPLAAWGAGTRRLSALAIAEQNQGEHPITLVDEIERGLEPYRQRSLLGTLQAGKSQVFITTHSSATLSAASKAALWYVDHVGRIGSIDAVKAAKHRADDPDTFLSRLAIICEGVTEVGFATALLERAFGELPQQHGVYLSDGGGHDATVLLLEALADGGVQFGGFADDECKYSTRWENIAKEHGDLLFRWTSGCIEQNIIGAISEGKLEELLTDPDGKKTGMRLRTLADRLCIAEKDFASIKTKAGAGLKKVIIEAATGTVPPGKDDEKHVYKNHAQTWFKSEAGGCELTAKVFSLGAWESFRAQLLPFCNAVRRAVGLPDIADLQL